MSNETQLRFRAGSRTDATFIAELARIALAPFGRYDTLLMAWLESGEVATVIAYEKDPIGFAMIGFYRSGEITIADLLAIAVTPAAQKRGVGTKLLDRALDLTRSLAQRTGATEVRLSVSEHNATALQMFSHAGFSTIDEEPGSYDGGQRALRMKRGL